MGSLLVPVGEDDLLGLRAIARLRAAGDGEAHTLEALAADLMKRGLAGALVAVSLPWAPRPGLVEERLSSSTGEPSVGDIPISDEIVERSGPGSADHGQRGRIGTALSDDRVRRTFLGITLTGLVVVLIGGYWGQWRWTGFEANDQVWDWLQLLLLPVAIGTFPLWLRYGQHMSKYRKFIFGLLVLAFAGFVIAGYVVPLEWTGFSGNTLRSWLTLIVLPLTVTTVFAWPSSPRESHRAHVIIFASLGVGWVVSLIGGYAARWSWTGYQGSTLWDWLQLLLAPGAVVTIFMPTVVRWVSGDVERIAKEAEEALRREGREVQADPDL
jgi:hypothetical protein